MGLKISGNQISTQVMNEVESKLIMITAYSLGQVSPKCCPVHNNSLAELSLQGLDYRDKFVSCECVTLFLAVILG